MTLVELLVTMTILAIIGSAVLFASFSATQAARTASTRAKVAALHSLVMEKQEEFRTRRVNAQIIDDDPTKALRVHASWLLMQMELPDRWSDITFAPIQDNPAATQVSRPRIGSAEQSPGLERTSLANAYLRRFQQIANATNKRTGQKNTGEQVTDNQGAECLYMIVTLATADGEALSLFRESDIGDVDGDGAPEFLDAWGRPISFIRWAPGFTPFSDLQSGDTVNDHDPADPFRHLTFVNKNAPAYRLVPLIYSAGPDGNYGIENVKTGVRFVQEAWPCLELKEQSGQAVLLGQPTPEDTWQDNIHNHEKETRQ